MDSFHFISIDILGKYVTTTEKKTLFKAEG